MSVVENLRALGRRARSLAADSPQLVSVVSEFRASAESLANLVRRPHEVTPSPGFQLALSHYTSLETMYKIVSAGPDAVLRLYDSVHVNDPKEGIASPEGAELAKKLTSMCPSSKHKTLSSCNGAARFSTAYILSFVADKSNENPGDDLSFWRTYGRDGGGCSFTFFPYLSGWSPKTIAGLRRVHYGDLDIGNFSKEIILLLEIYDKLFSLACRLPDVAATLSESQSFLDECFARRFLTKNSAYWAENEFRFVEFPDSGENLCYELANGEIRHYLDLCEFRLESLASTSTVLCVGPAVPHGDDAVEALLGLWRQKWAGSSVPYIKVQRSTIPYRSSI